MHQRTVFWVSQHEGYSVLAVLLPFNMTHVVFIFSVLITIALAEFPMYPLACPDFWYLLQLVFRFTSVSEKKLVALLIRKGARDSRQFGKLVFNILPIKAIN